MFGESLYRLQVGLYGSLRVITTLEFLQHHFSEMGHRDLLVTQKYPYRRPNATTLIHA